MSIRDEVLRIVYDRVPATLLDDLKDYLRFVDANIRSVKLVGAAETAAVAIRNEKTAALFYDRVWTGFGGDVPTDIAFRGARSLRGRMESPREEG